MTSKIPVTKAKVVNALIPIGSRRGFMRALPIDWVRLTLSL